MSKIAICSTGDTQSSLMDGRMGRCAYFIIYDTEQAVFSAIRNTGIDAAHGAGTGSVQVLLKQQVGIIIANRVGPKAFTAIQQGGIKIYACTEGTTVEVALQKYQNGDLKEITAPGH